MSADVLLERIKAAIARLGEWPPELKPSVNEVAEMLAGAYTEHDTDGITDFYLEIDKNPPPGPESLYGPHYNFTATAIYRRYFHFACCVKEPTSTPKDSLNAE